MKIPYFVAPILLTIFCFMMFIKAIDIHQVWAIVLSVVGILTFAILSIVALFYQLRQHGDNKLGH